MKLYECRSCGVVGTAKMGGCPSCGFMESDERDVPSLGGGTETKTTPWYRVHRVVTE